MIVLSAVLVYLDCVTPSLIQVATAFILPVMVATWYLHDDAVLASRPRVGDGSLDFLRLKVRDLIAGVLRLILSPREVDVPIVRKNPHAGSSLSARARPV
jgi:hypothetical protein